MWKEDTMKKDRYASVTNDVATESGVRIDSMAGKEYTVVPCIMMVEGVHAGSGGPIYYPPEELAKTPAVWNHKPVVVYHPKSDTACSPEVLTNRKIGIMMNTKWEEGKLKTEAWLDMDRVKEVDERVSNAIEKGQMLEVSTGLYLDLEEKEGTWNSESYVGVATNYRPDHLAILPDIRGACSIDDGAGFLRLNHETKEPLSISQLFYEAFRPALDVIGFTGNENSHGEIREMLHQALRDDAWVAEVWENEFVYEQNDLLYKQDYGITNNKVVLIGIPTQVQRDVSYVPVKNDDLETKENKMKKDEKIKAIMAVNEKWTQEQLEAMDDGVLDIIHNMIPEEKPEPKTEVHNAAEEGAEGIAPNKKVDNQEEPKTQTVEDYIANAPAEMRDVLKSGVAAHNAKKETLIKTITANERNTFKEEYLQNKDLAELEALAKLATNGQEQPEGDMRFNYAGQGEPAAVSNEEPLLAPVMTFDEK